MNRHLIEMSLQLFHILPGDIVFYIFTILKTSNAVEVLIKNYRKRKLKFTCMDNFIKNILFNNITENNTFYRTVSEDNIKNIETILTNNYKSYNITFWQNILSLMSKNIMNTNINYSLSMYYNFMYKNDKKYINKTISLWLKLCKKFNIKFILTLKKNNNANNLTYETITLSAKNIIKMNNFDKLLYSPSIIFTSNDWYYDENNFQYFNMTIDNDVAYRYLVRTKYNI